MKLTDLFIQNGKNAAITTFTISSQSTKIWETRENTERKSHYIPIPL